MVSRLLPLVLLLATLLSGCAAAPGEAGAYAVEIRGPHGTLWNGTVELAGEEATAMGALRAAAHAAGLGVELERTALGTYVRGVGPHRETASEGWCFFVVRDGVAVAALGAADATGLRRGDAVLWSWTSTAPGPC